MVHRALLAARGAFAFVLAGMAYAGATTPAISPDPEVQLHREVADAGPQLSFKGQDVTISGSVGGLFDEATFTAPMDADMVASASPEEEASRFSDGFEAARTRLAALRRDSDPAAAPTPHTAGSGLSLAAVDPKLISAALDAIAKVDKSTGETTGSDDPFPQSMPQKLAYARADTPPTSFDTPIARQKVSSKDLWCLSTAIYFEARGESYRGQVAVAQVVMNRVNSTIYPKTICGVVFQNQYRRNACQFSFACDGIPETVTDKKSWAQAEDIAQKVTAGSLYLPEVGGATHYHATYVHPDWAPRMKKVTQIGLHIFYRFRTSRG